MTDLASTIFKKYGLAAIVFALIGGSLIWFLAHWAASPGTEVSVLWGLVKYTKPVNIQNSKSNDGIINQEKTKTSTQKNTIQDSSIYSSIAIELKNGITTKNFEKAMSTFRVAHKVRELTALESGKKVSEFPTGTYFFFYASSVLSYSSWSAKTTVLSTSAERYRSSRRYIEAHSIANDGIYILGLLSESDAAQISNLSGKVSHNIVLSPVPTGSMTTLVSLPLDRIESSDSRSIQISQDEDYTVLDIRVK